MRFVLASLACCLAVVAAPGGDGNRLAYLDDLDPYYPHRTFPRLTTPQWIGEDGVDAVVVLAIDDMRGHEKWEAYLRPILERLKTIDGRAAASIMTCRIDPADPHLQTWLKEGVSLETHTIDHPCPILRKGDLAAAKSTYDRCVDLLAAVPNSKPIAFRTPCCDSLNTVSPRLFAEVFNKTTPKGNFLQLDSSVFVTFTADDPELPRELVNTPDGSNRFLKYRPADRTFVNAIEDYPYPYIIGRLCWEFPCVTPSDWAAQHLHKPNNPLTVQDWCAALDATVAKKGVFNLVFHPHGWIKSEQVVALIDHAQKKHGKRVKFLTFREALDRLNKHLLAGQPLRDPTTGADNGVRLLDVNGDGFTDVVIGNAAAHKTRVWDPKKGKWDETEFPCLIERARFGVIDGKTVVIAGTPDGPSGWRFDGSKWVADASLSAGLPKSLGPFRLLDFDGDGRCELIADGGRAVFAAGKEGWQKLPFALPDGASLPDSPDRDTGLRFADLDGDGKLDLLFSNESGFGVYRFESMKAGWRKVSTGKPGEPNALPPIAIKGANNGAFIRDRTVYWQNETTDLLKDLIDRRSFNDLLSGVEPGPKSPEQSRKLMTVRPGYRVELAAAEPLVQDPVAVEWGPDGKLWVVEMGDYPLGTDGKGKPGGRVKFLEDTDGDGRYDKATVFLDGIGFPNGVLPWRKGVLVTAAPDLFYAEDTDGDGRADVKKVLFTGFVEGNQQHRVNGLVGGLDNWVYCANGDSGGKVKSVRTGKTLDIRGRDFRIKPDTGEIEPTSGQSQYSKCRDDWGNWFGGNNSLPFWHVVLEDRYLKRNPHLAAPAAIHQPSAVPGPAPVYPTSRTVARFNDLWAANRFTSACGICTYRDTAFAPSEARSLYVCEPVHNLVSRRLLTAGDFTFTARRAEDERHSEFLASADGWFRPVQAKTGPDGALWVVDMYRYVIEHPQWIPPDWQKRLDLRAGHDMGRIYRVVRESGPLAPRADGADRSRSERTTFPRLDKLDTAGLVAALDSPSGWQRDMAHRMLVWRSDKAAVPLLEKLARKSLNPLARLHAYCVLDGMNALTAETLLKARGEKHPLVVRRLIRLCEGRFGQAAELGTWVASHVRDEANALQAVCSLGEWDDPRAGAAIGTAARVWDRQPVVLAAAFSSLTAKDFPAVAEAALGPGFDRPPGPRLVEGLLTFAVARKDAKTLAKLLGALARPEGGTFAAWQLDALAALLDALDRRKTTLAELGKSGGGELRTVLDRLAPAFDQARKTATDLKADPAARLTAVRLLGRGAGDRTLLADLLGPQSGPDLQAAAVAAIARSPDAAVPATLLRPWKGYSPAVRPAVLAALLSRDAWVPAVLDAVAAKQLPPAEIDAAARQRLSTHPTAAVRDRASKLLAGGADADRARVVTAYRPALTKPGDPEKGKQVFTRVCAACHKLGDAGHGLGPDLTALSDKSADYLLTNVLDPNRSVEARYVGYVAQTADGRTRVGFLTAETATGVTLVGADGQPQTILRADLDALTSTGKSAMPEGVEKDVTVGQMADLLAFLRSALPAAKRKEFAGNRPHAVRPAGDGSLRLPASAAEVYGPSLVYEPKHANLGYWGSADDRAIWTVAPPAAGAYEVWIDYACPADAAGNAVAVEAGGKAVSGRVEGTGDWDTYKMAKLGVLKLAAGEQRITARAVPPLKGYLLDLRGVRLIPARFE
ncbi:MAG TPA: PVC-type heme-binding CxxCH protein [Fimbriiglobus sp.]|nr:PVC-type heme-binding CxxCH protein [Fimbriiglobus sp.]